MTKVYILAPGQIKIVNGVHLENMNDKFVRINITIDKEQPTAVNPYQYLKPRK